MSVDQKVKLQLGEAFVAQLAMSERIEALTKENDELKAKVEKHEGKPKKDVRP